MSEEGRVPIRRALVSVSDKTGIEELGRALAARKVEILSTGGTAEALRKAGVPVTDVSKVTGFPEMLDGRVKTLHPVIHGGILAVRSKPSHMEALRKKKIVPIDLVVVNLYPFESTVARPDICREEAIEQIDIGGPAMIRSAAKNADAVAVIVDSAQIPRLLSEFRTRDGATTLEFRRALAAEAFARTAVYDAAIAGYLSPTAEFAPPVLMVRGAKVANLRYGENPHQRAALYRQPGRLAGIVGARQLAGKELSYNNLLDADAAWRAASEFDRPACVIVKHLIPCGAAVAANLSRAYQAAHDADPVSAFGGIAGFNRELDGATAKKMEKLFLEVVVAPSFSKAALETFAAKKNLRILAVETDSPYTTEVRSISGGYLLQEVDRVDLEREPKVVTRRKPTAMELRDLRFAWKIVKHVRSNAIVLARSEATVGIGAGQTNRVGAVRQAVQGAGSRARGSVMASDAFFPFADGLVTAAKAGVKAVIQPGGSVRDGEVIAAADRAGVAMLFTKIRHFRH